MSADRFGAKSDGAAGRLLGGDAILVRADDGSARLLDLDGDFVAISSIGAEMVVLASRHGEGAAAVMLAGAYGMPPEVVREDLRRLLGDLDRRGYLATSGGAVRPGPVGRLLRAAHFRTVRLALGGGRRSRWRALLLLTLACAGFRALGWTRTVSAWRRASDGPAAAPDRAVVDEVDRVVVAAAAHHPVPAVACKERGLVVWAMLRRSGQPARLVVGLDFDPFRGHCWCESGGRVVADHADRCAGYTEIVSHT